MNQKWWILASIATALSTVCIDVTVLPVSLPTIQRDLGLSTLGLQWLVNTYILTLTVFLLMGGRLADRYGQKKVLCLGLFAFVTGSVLCGLSQVEWEFIGSRFIQGLGAALLLPASASTLFSSFPLSERGKALGYYGGIASFFTSIGPFVGGFCCQYLSWHFIFWVNIPIGIIALFMILRIVPKGDTHSTHFDWWGLILSTCAISSITIALLQAQVWGWTSWVTLSLSCLSLLTFTILYKVDRKVHDPYIDFSLFKGRTFYGSVIGLFSAQFLTMLWVFWAVYFQTALGYSPLNAGSLALLAGAPTIITAPLGGHLLDKHGPKLPIAIGLFLIVSSLFWFIHIVGNPNIYLILSAILPFGCGLPLILTPCITTAIAKVAPARRGLAISTIGTIRQFGGAIGLSMMGSIFSKKLISQFKSDLEHHKETSFLQPESFKGLLAKSPESEKAFDTLTPGAQEFVLQSYTNSYLDAFNLINGVALALTIVLIGLSFWLITIRKAPEIEM